MRTFLDAMDTYEQQRREGSPLAIMSLRDAVRTLDTSRLTPVTHRQESEEAAIFLKETLDRVWERDFDALPGVNDIAESPPARWGIPETEITLTFVDEGEQEGSYLFSSGTVSRAREFFERVNHLPYLSPDHQGAGYREPWLIRQLPDWAADEFLTLRTWQWMGIFGAILLGLVMRLIVQGVARLVARMMNRAKFRISAEALQPTISPVALLVATSIWYGALQSLRLQGLALTFLMTVIQVLFFISVTWIFYSIASVFASYLMSFAKRSDTGLDEQLANLISRTVKIVVVLMGVLLAAQNLGVQVFSVLAGLGIGGLAVALAAQDSLANFFGSIMIMLDRPFKVGHWVKVGDLEGTVEEIGFRSTRIRTFYNSVIVVPNTKVATTAVDNMGLRQFRRVRTTIGLTYDTPPEKLEAFLEGIKNIILANPATRKDFFHVVFNDFGPSSLDILVYFFLRVPDWSRELVERQNVLLEIVHLAQTLDVRFAFPTQSLHVESMPGQPHPGHPPVGHEMLAGSAKAYGPGGDRSRPEGSGLFVPPYKDPAAK